MWNILVGRDDGVAVRNRLKWWRHELRIDRQKDFANFLGVTPQQLSLWETQQQQPNLETLIKLWKKLRTKIPYINLQDLIEDDSPE
ncbi:helix-turn-helix domain-containing protein [Neomoorella thermoacetica]|uniref:helix-turn-helix domain-containing protein n=1 Tax=Neomoorella thermoacetica TaxID=1525 RepID=UPI003BB20DA8